MSRLMRESTHTAANLRATLGLQNITRAELARRMNRTEMWVGRRCNAQTELTLEEVAEFAAALDVPISDLLPGEWLATA